MNWTSRVKESTYQRSLAIAYSESIVEDVVQRRSENCDFFWYGRRRFRIVRYKKQNVQPPNLKKRRGLGGITLLPINGSIQEPE